MAAKQKKAKKSPSKRRIPGATASSSPFSAAATARRNGPLAVAMKGKNKAKNRSNDGGSSSLFESRWTKSKFEVVGKKRKSTGIRVGLSRSAAIEKRKKTILHEFQSRDKANVFLDHRFGEDDETLKEEDKAILRFQRERQAQWQKKSKFALPDEEEEAILTHHGTALSYVDDFEDNLSGEDDEEAKELDEELVRKFHFGGDFNDGHADQSERVKSKKEIMEEIIAKSKFYKGQKAKEKEEDAELNDHLDKEFAELSQSQALISLVRPKKGKASRNDLDTDLAGDEKPDDFDKLVKEMGMEMRAHASDRVKGDEELAAEEKALLEELEEKRRKRMLGETDSDDSDIENSATRQNSSREKKRRRSEVSGDDLGENFALDDDEPKVGWVDEILARDGNDEEDSENEDDAGSEEEDNDDESGSEEEDNDDESGSEEDGDASGSDGANDEHDDVWEKSDEDNELVSFQKAENQKVVKQQNLNSLSKRASQEEDGKGRSEIPFVIDAPKNFEELKNLVDNRSVADLLLIIQRIRTCNSIRLASENRRKMQIFYGILLQYFSHVANEKVPALHKLNALVKPLIEMTSETPYFAAVCARERIVRMHSQLVAKLKTPSSDGPWPSLRSLALLRIWSMTFPPSDFRHVVMTPSVLLMTEHLMRCPVNSAKDLAVGTFICGLILSIMRPARRFCPEALSFLYAASVSALPKKNGLEESISHGCGSFMLELVASQPWLMLLSKFSKSSNVEELDFGWVMTASKDDAYFGTDKFRVSVLNCLLGTLAGFCHIYEDIPCYPEIFNPFMVLLQVLSEHKHLPAAIVELLNNLLGQMQENIQKHEKVRQPLRMRIKKPTPIKQFNPKFEENFVRGKNYDPDRERAEGKKLQRLLKQEAKGAARELRKDNYFLLAEKAKEKAIHEQQRDDKYRKAMAFLQEQESAFKSGQLGKGRKKRK